MKRMLLSLAICVLSARGDTWSDLGGAWYNPYGYASDSTYEWEVVDTSGDTQIISFNENGSNADEVIGSIKTSVKSLFVNVAGLATKVADNARHLETIDQEFEMLSETLDSVVADIYAKLEEIKFQDEKAPSSPTVYKTTVENKYLTLVGPSLEGDKKSVTRDKDGKYGLFGFEGNADKTFAIPYIYGGSLAWSYIGLLGDGNTIENGSDADDRPISIGLAGWESPQSGSHLCQDELGEMLTGVKDGASHYVLTKHGQNLHYTRIGSITAGAAKTDMSSIVTNAPGHEGEASIAGFWTADVGTSPVKTADGKGIEWKAPGGGINITDSKGATASGTNIVFSSSGNVKATIESAVGGTVTIKFEAFYK